MPNSFIPTHGGYRKLQSYQKSEIIYDATVYFTKRFFDQRDRTVDQMVQAARSGKQNIAEASMASGNSKEFEIKLTNVARASLEELLIDYQDYLRTKGLLEWPKEHPYAMRLRDLLQSRNANYEHFSKGIEHKDPEICANVIIDLIKVATYLLYKQICRLEEDFLKQGGMRERMTKARLASRRSK